MACERHFVTHIRIAIPQLSSIGKDMLGTIRWIPASIAVGKPPPKPFCTYFEFLRDAMSDSNVVYIGNKPVMNYCLAVLSSLQGNSSTVTLKARGRAISTAVDVAEVTRSRFMEDLAVENIEIGTEELEGMGGQARNVSTISIILKKG